MGHQRQLLLAVEGDEIPDRPLRSEEPPEPFVGKDALDEVVAQLRIREATLLLDGKVQESFDERCGEQAPSRWLGRACLTVHEHTVHAARRRVLLQDVAAQVLVAQFVHTPLGVALHRGGVIGVAGGRPETDLSSALLEPDGLARRRHPHLDLRTDRHPLNVMTEDVREPGVAFVTSVETDRRAEQARRHADPDAGPGKFLSPGRSLPLAGFRYAGHCCWT